MVTTDLDRKSKRVLEAIYHYGGEAEMGEIKEYTGIEKNGIVLYRLNDKLRPKGLVETRKVDHGDGSLGVTVASLTDQGRQVVGRVLDDDESGPSLAEQVQILKGTVEDLREDVQMYEGHIDELEEELELYRDTHGEVDDIRRLLDRADDVEDRAPLVEKVTVENLGEEWENTIGSVSHLASDLATRQFVLAHLLDVFEEAGMIRVSEHMKEEMEIPDILQAEYDQMSITPGPSLEGVETGPARHAFDVVASGVEVVEEENGDLRVTSIDPAAAELLSDYSNPESKIRRIVSEDRNVPTLDGPEITVEASVVEEAESA